MSAAVQSNNSAAVSFPIEASPPSLSEIKQNYNGSKSSTRVYVSNLSYTTTEEELEDFFKAFSILTVLIPSHTVRGFRSSKHRPLGIAYAEFSSPEQAQKACDDLNGTVLKNRKLVIKAYVPYQPQTVPAKPAKSRNRRSKGSASPKESEAKAENENSTSPISEPLSSDGNKNENEEVGDNNVPACPDTNIESEAVAINQATSIPVEVDKVEPVSESIVFVGKLPSKTLDTDLREFFAPYNPGSVYIFRGKSTAQKHRGSLKFRQRYVSALVETETEDSLEKIIQDLASKKLNGRQVTLRPAYLAKIDEVIKAAANQAEEQVVVSSPEETNENNVIDDNVDLPNNSEAPQDGAIDEEAVADVDTETIDPATNAENSYDYSYE